MEEKIQYIIENFSLGEVKDIHMIRDYFIVEYEDDIHGTMYRVYVNFEDTYASFLSLDRAIIGAMTYKHNNQSMEATEYACRILKVRN